MAVGEQSSGVDQTLAEAFNAGTWSVLPTFNTTNTQTNLLNAVSCPTTTWCMAAGYEESSGHQEPMTQVYQGGAWSNSNSLTPNAGQNTDATAISCPTTTFCVAVGWSGNNRVPWSETWNGATWALDTSIAPPPMLNGNYELYGVSCPSAAYCTAVGFADTTVNEIGYVVVSTDGGNTWSFVPGAGVNAFTTLNAVSCTSPTFCSAVGGASLGEEGEITFAEQWNGTMWSVVPTPTSPVPGALESEMLGVSCVSPASCAAVGYSVTTLLVGIQFVMGFNGRTWSAISAEHVAGALNEVNGVSCAATSMCLTVGNSSPGPTSATLALIGPTLAPEGYWVVGKDGGVFGFNATFFGSVPGLGIHVNNIVGIAAAPDGHGYWLLGSDGGVFGFGSALFYGSLPGSGIHVNNAVAIASSPSGHGYWVVDANGGVYSYGDAAFFGSVPGVGVSISNVVGIAASPSGGGYFITAADGSVYAFGVPYAGGSTHATNVVGIAATTGTNGGGYWLASATGGLGAYDAPSIGSLIVSGVTVGNIVGVSSTNGGDGVWMVGSDGGVFTLGGAPFLGSLPAIGVSVNNIDGIAAT